MEPDWDRAMTFRKAQSEVTAVDSIYGTILVAEAVANLRRVTDRVSVKVNVNHIPYDSEELGSC